MQFLLRGSLAAAVADVAGNLAKTGERFQNGIELAEHILEEKPGTKVLVMSGLPNSLALAAEKGYPSLAKPFTSITLTERVREVLAA